MSQRKVTAAEAYKLLRPTARKKLKGLVKQAHKNAKRGRTETLRANKLKGK